MQFIDGCRVVIAGPSRKLRNFSSLAVTCPARFPVLELFNKQPRVLIIEGFSEEDWHMPIESPQYFIILFRVDQVFTFYYFTFLTLSDFRSKCWEVPI